ncbi:MAG: DUF805 domain-containing protein [Hydrotalea sp.]|nr:DUF805 domain-containing protein [Hydrotalea sp.]
MNLSDSIKTCFGKYITFSGRASRSEFWWFQVFRFVIWWMPLIGWLFWLASILPAIAVTVRRLHDTNHSGFYLLPLIFVPVWPVAMAFPLLNLQGVLMGMVGSTMMGVAGISHVINYSTAIMNYISRKVHYVLTHDNISLTIRLDQPTHNLGAFAILLTMMVAIYSLVLLWWLLKRGNKGINNYGLR